MAKKLENAFVFFNMLTLTFLICLAYVLGRFTDHMHIIKNPLIFTEVVSASLILWIVLGMSTLHPEQSKAGTTAFTAHGVMQTGLAFAAWIIGFFLLAILYGAPAIENISETFHFALLLSSVTVVPTVCVIGTSPEEWNRVLVQNKVESYRERCIQVTTLCSLLGAWLGAVPIPLDWDRPWQVWPISCLIGTLTGYGIGLILSSTYVRWHYNHSEKTKLG